MLGGSSGSSGLVGPGPLWEDAPGLSRLLLTSYFVFTIVLGIASLHTNISSLAYRLFACTLDNTVMHLSLWTVFTSLFYRPVLGVFSFFFMLMEIYMALNYFPCKEKELGSALFGIWLLLANCCITIVFLSFSAFRVYGLLDVFGSYSRCTGLWPVVMLLLTQRRLSDPEGSSSFWGLFVIQNKLYPLVILGIFCLFSSSILWDLLAAVALGYMPYLKPELNFERLMPLGWPVTFLDRLGAGRSYFGGSWLVASSGQATSSYRQLAGNPQPQGSVRSQPQPDVRPQPQSNMRLFSGAGHRLGTTASPREPPANVGGANAGGGSRTLPLLLPVEPA